MPKVKKTKPVKILTDFLGKTVNPGEKVIMLYKIRGFRGLDNARLAFAVYTGYGQHGYAFDMETVHGGTTVIRMRDPEVIKYTEQVVIKIPESVGLRKEVEL